MARWMVPGPLVLLVSTVFAGAAAPASAGPLDELRQTLDGLRATVPVAGSLTLEVTGSTDGEEGPGSRKGIATVRVAAGEDGVTVRVPAALLAQVRVEQRESRSKEDETTSSSSAALREVTATLADQLLDAAAILRQTLEYAAFESQQPVQGKDPGARELTFRLNPPMSEKERKRFREFDLTLAVTVNGEGIPVAARQQTRLRGRVLLMSFEFTSSEETRYSVVGDRLVVVRQEKEERGSGMGQRNESRKVFTLAVDAPAVTP